MINRVTHQTMQKTSLANLQANLRTMSDLQGKLSGGKAITKPSDDPAGTALTLQLRADKRAAEQAGRNAADGAAWLEVADSSLQTSLSTLRRVRDLTVQGANGAVMNATSREAIANELVGLRDSLLSDANTSYLGRSVFAGTGDAGVAFSGADGTPPYSWLGSDGGAVTRRLAPDTTVRVDVDGRAAYGEGEESVFAVLDRIISDLRSGTAVAPRLDEIDARMTGMLGELGSVGTRHNQVMTAQSAVLKTIQDLTGSISSVEDIDVAATIVELQSQEVAYQAALGATARVLQPSLMDFLR